MRTVLVVPVATSASVSFSPTLMSCPAAPVRVAGHAKRLSNPPPRRRRGDPEVPHETMSASERSICLELKPPRPPPPWPRPTPPCRSDRTPHASRVAQHLVRFADELEFSSADLSPLLRSGWHSIASLPVGLLMSVSFASAARRGRRRNPASCYRAAPYEPRRVTDERDDLVVVHARRPHHADDAGEWSEAVGRRPPV